MSEKKSIKVVELFAGVGGFRLGLEGWKGNSASSNYTKKLLSNYKVVWSNQWEPSSKKDGHLQEANLVYHNRFVLDSEGNGGCIHNPYDIDKSASPDFTDKQVRDNIPDHQLLVGGFPCQDYSVAGVNTKGIQGKKGVLWWNIHKIIKARRPNYILLENVDRLLKSPTNQRGRDFAIILSTLNDLGYDVEWRVVNSADYGMPQRRKRVFILAFHKDSKLSIDFNEKFLFDKGVFAECFPIEKKGKVESIVVSNNVLEITDNYNEGKFLNAGIMKNGKVLMSDFSVSPSLDKTLYSESLNVLKDVIEEVKKSNTKISNEFWVNTSKELKNPLHKIVQSGFESDKRLKRDGDVITLENELDKWIYLKGKKAEQRTSSKGTFYYKEGPMKLVDDINEPSRTIITSEGGPGASRFKHLIEEEGKYRRLLPEELELLNMFPLGHTAVGSSTEQKETIPLSSAKRAFFMGNALVVGVVEAIGKELNKRVYNEV